jgi:hypothetical protein
MKYINQITAIVCALLLGGSFLFVQVNKQSSIEKQAQMKIDQENKILEEEKAEQTSKEVKLRACLSGADREYWDYIELNMEERENGIYWGDQYKWDNAENKKKNAEDVCFKRYK